MPRRRPRPPGWSRLDRVNEAVREVVADELERIGDDRLDLVTVTGVRVEADLRRAVVWFSALTTAGPDADTDAGSSVEGVLAGHRVRLQAALGRQLRLKRTPELDFRLDPAIARGTRVDDILRGLEQPVFEQPGLEQQDLERHGFERHGFERQGFEGLEPGDDPGR